jgi:hypothetical protein
VEGDRLAVDADLALVRALHAVQDLHERGLARAVLTDDGMDVTLGHAQVDVAVGHDAGEPLGDPLEFHGWLGDGRGADGGLLRGECLVTDSDFDSRPKGPGMIPPGPLDQQTTSRER